MAGPVDWALAERVAVRLATRSPAPDPGRAAVLGPHLEELTARAEELVAVETGLRSQHGRARARVVGRPEWVRANIASFQRLLRPVLDKVDHQLSARRANVSRTVMARVAGAELGALLGWMSSRVLGQYDLLVVDDETATEQDLVYYVGPNLLSLESRYAFAPSEFRLWIALHEVTHRAQFTGVPWLRPHFLELVNRTLDAVDPDPARFVAALRETVQGRAGRHLADAGLLGLLASPEQRALLGQVSGLMALLEGHGERTMDRAGGDLVPSAERFHRVLRARRANLGAPARLVQRLLGIEAKLAQYEQGERFLAAIEAAAGPHAVDRCWEGPASLPTLDEIRDPQAWLGRVGLGTA